MQRVPAELCLPRAEVSEPRLGTDCLVYGCSVEGVAYLALHDLPLPEGPETEIGRAHV